MEQDQRAIKIQQVANVTVNLELGKNQQTRVSVSQALKNQLSLLLVK